MERLCEMRTSVRTIQEILRHADPTYLDTTDLASLVVALSPLPRAVYAPDDFARRIQAYLTRRGEKLREEMDLNIKATTTHLESDPEWPHFLECVDAAWSAIHKLQKFTRTISMFPHEISLCALKKWSPWPGPRDNFLVFGEITCHFSLDTTGSDESDECTNGSDECITMRILLSEIFITTYAWPTLEMCVRINRVSGRVITDTVSIISPDPMSCTASDGLMAVVAAHAVGATIIDIPPGSKLHTINDRVVALAK